MSGIGRLIFVSVLAVIGFVVALVSFRQVPVRECEMAATPDSSYSATIVEPPTVNGTVYTLAVTHQGTPVHGAMVCLRADMGGAGGMSGMGVSNVARETAPGRYQIDVMFQMGGHWQGRIVIEEPGRSAVETNLVLTVT
ncbi:MAG TPA: FixH family protein [Acidimicrobiales bacterium]|nr:FixH family protein [Acidimicrobiales bacterium]